jgi:hypothetical protein
VQALSRPVLYPEMYPWLVLVASMDVMMTWVCLWLGGTEFNPIAAVIIEAGGLAGALLLKFSVVILVICVCEFVGRRNSIVAQRLGRVSIGLNCFPVAAAFLQLGAYMYLHGGLIAH